MSIEPSQIDPKSGTRPLIIAVIGGADPPPWAAALAEEVGRELAKRQVVVVCGGLTGVMAAVCRGAKAEGGTTIGILPGTDPDASSPYVDYPILTGMGYARNVIVVKTGRAAIAIDGAYGTLSEIGHALGDSTPVIGLRTWELAPEGGVGIQQANSAVEAVEMAIAAARGRD